MDANYFTTKLEQLYDMGSDNRTKVNEKVKEIERLYNLRQK